MIRPVAFLRWCGGLALIAAVATFAPTPASADSFAFSYGTGHYRPYYGPYHHPYWGPHYRSSVVVVSPPPVYYPPPPPVVYVPAPAPVVTPMVDATPASEPYRTADGRYCREYTTTTRVGGVLQSSYGTACLQPDGSWRIVN
ncbi:MAG TPA: hypothetical protein VL966_08485 [Alphaproteobacteria bacterium]|jgi:hypothetical protein|nr:hypothetical protein [Alphaproteobacteria bacterium]